MGGIAPFAFIHDREYQFLASEIIQRDQVLDRLELAAKKRGSKAHQTIVAAMKESTREFLAREKNTEGRRTSTGRIADMLNEAVQSDSLYSAEIWPTADKRKELKELLAKPQKDLTKTEQEHINRRLIEYSFEGQVSKINDDRIWVGYAGMKIGNALPLSESQSRLFVESIVLQLVMKVGLGIVAMFVAIIVTSSMVPDMFQPGSLHLLLSKPISRSLLFLSKFLGGCIFVAINITFLLVGLYFIAGFRLGIWNQGLLLCIPLFVFIFAIFYSVSALTGLVWKNAIVSIVVTAIFWLVCFVIGVAYGVMKPFVEIMPEIVEVCPVKDQLVVVHQEGGISMWDPSTKTWQGAFDRARGGGLKVIGPFWFPDRGQLFYGRTMQSPFGVESDNVRMTMVNLAELKSGGSESGEADPDKDGKSNTELWSDKRTDNPPNFPLRTRRAIELGNSLVVLTDLGLFEIDRDKLTSKPETQGAIANMMRDVFNRITPTKSSSFKQLTPETWQLQPPMDFSATPDNHSIVVYHRGKIEVLRADESGKWIASEWGEAIDGKDKLALIAANNQRWILAGSEMVPTTALLDSQEPPRELSTLGKIKPRKLITSKDGSFVLLTADGDVWWIDANGENAKKPNLAGQGSASAISFDDNGKLIVAHHVRSVDRWDLGANQSESVARPNSSVLERVFYWAITPIYTANPKPSSVDDTIEYCLRREDSVNFSLDTAALTNARPKVDPWQPIWSNSIFIVIMLTISCLYLHRQDL